MTKSTVMLLLLPPKLKGMRWRPYEQVIAQIEQYDGLTDERTLLLMARFLKQG